MFIGFAWKPKNIDYNHDFPLDSSEIFLKHISVCALPPENGLTHNQGVDSFNLPVSSTYDQMEASV
jgi:hypothetical protein